MKIDREDLLEFVEDHIVTKPGGKLIRILPFEFDEFLKEQEDKNDGNKSKS